MEEEDWVARPGDLPTPERWPKMDFKLFAYHQLGASGIKSAEEGTAWYETLRALLAGEPAKYLTYRDTLAPRITKFYSSSSSRAENDYGYAQVRLQAPSDGMPKPLQKLVQLSHDVLKEDEQKCSQSPLDAGLVNYYRNFRDGVAAHADRDALCGTIVSYSFGPQPRLFRIRDINTKEILMDVWLSNGDRFVMYEGFQLKYWHEIVMADPKDPIKYMRQTGNQTDDPGRINVTLRQHQRMLMKPDPKLLIPPTALTSKRLPSRRRKVVKIV